MAAAAFVHLSRYPPLMMPGIGKYNDTRDMILDAGCFDVSVLSEQQIPLSNRYAGSDPDRYRFMTSSAFASKAKTTGCSARVAQPQSKRRYTKNRRGRPGHDCLKAVREEHQFHSEIVTTLSVHRAMVCKLMTLAQRYCPTSMCREYVS
jgi:hypothetical protein